MDPVELYTKIKKLLEDAEIDLLKNKAGNKQAGVQLRRGLSDAKKAIGELSKASLAADKARKEAKKEAK